MQGQYALAHTLGSSVRSGASSSSAQLNVRASLLEQEARLRWRNFLSGPCRKDASTFGKKKTEELGNRFPKYPQEIGDSPLIGAISQFTQSRWGLI